MAHPLLLPTLVPSVFGLILGPVQPFLGVEPTSAPGGTAPEPVLAITIDAAILTLAKPPAATTTTLRVQPRNFPSGARLDYRWRQVQDEMVPGAARMADKPIAFSTTDRAEVTATFPAPGVYEVRLTVTDPVSKRTASRNAWINVWDPAPALEVEGRPDPLTVIPGMTAPAVRTLSPDPGPFVHPRLYCTPAEWADINARCVGGKSILANTAWKGLLSQYSAGIGAKTKEGAVLAALEAYADAGFTGEAPDLAPGAKDAKAYELQLYSLGYALGQASFVQWAQIDPALPQRQVPAERQAVCRRLGKLVGALGRVVLEAQWDRRTGAFKTGGKGFLRGFEVIGERTINLSGLALAYDFIVPWMTAEQQRDARNLLIAAGRGRKGDGQRTGHANAGDRWVERGYEQNGNFPSLGESNLLTGLVVSGEESAADPAVVKTFLEPEKPPGYATTKGPTGYDQVQPVGVDSGRDQPLSKPYPEAITWPHARKADVNNLQRQIWSWQDGHITPWGFTLERLAYFGSMADEVWPSAVVFARFGGFNQYVGCHFYQTVNNLLWVQYPSGGLDSTTASKSFASPLGMYEHHSGGGDYRQQHALLLKYMYPDDPLVDYVYASQAPQIENRVRNLLNTCIFGLDPTLKEMKGALEPIAAAKELSLTRLDPQEGIVVLRSGWQDDAAMLYFDAGATVWGHMNGERSSFSLFALGRHWSVPTGFHKVLSNFQSLVSVQHPDWAACPTTQGYMGVNPSLVPEVPGCTYRANFPTPPSHLLEVRESPDRLWSMAACDARTSYNCTFGATDEEAANHPAPPWTEHFYGNFPDVLRRSTPGHTILFPNRLRNLSAVRGCRLQEATRTVLMVRGQRPYALIVDDFFQGGPANWRWAMSDKITMQDEGRGKDDTSFCVVLDPGATATQGILRHQRDQGDKPGLPRLLVRDVSEADNATQPVLRMDQTSYQLGEEKYRRENTNRLFIERLGVERPSYKVLLFPFRTGEALPVTTWNGDRTELTIDLGGGIVDRIACTRTPGERTRCSVARRGGR